MNRAALVLIFMAAGPLMAAEEHCLPSETIRQCFHHFVPEQKASQDAAVQKAASDTQKGVAAANTGITNLASPTQSASKDFLSLLSAALDQAAQGNAAKPVTLDYNQTVSILGEQEQLKFQAILAKPDLSADLKQRLGDNAAGTKTLQDSLSYGDDVTLSATLNPATQRFGRSLNPHRQFFQSLLRVVFTLDASKPFALEQLIDALGLTKDAKPIDTPVNVLWPDAGKQTSALATIEEAMRAFEDLAPRTFSQSFADLLNNQPQLYGSAIFHSLKDIAGANETSVKVTYEYGMNNLNQFYAGTSGCTPAAVATLAPRVDVRTSGEAELDAHQLNLAAKKAADAAAKADAAKTDADAAAKKTAEDAKVAAGTAKTVADATAKAAADAAAKAGVDAAKADADSAKATANLEKATADSAASAAAISSMNACVSSLNTFAAKAASSDRFSLAIQYDRTDATAVDLPQYTVNYTVPSGHKFTYSVIYGRPMSVRQPADGRVDFSVNYEDTKVVKAEDVVSLSRRVPLDTAAATTVPPRDRLVASVTFTQKLSDTMSIPVSLIYANHAQFLSNVDKKLNVHFGLIYKLPTTP
jgi:hypothetical protein